MVAAFPAAPHAGTDSLSTTTSGSTIEIGDETRQVLGKPDPDPSAVILNYSRASGERDQSQAHNEAVQLAGRLQQRAAREAQQFVPIPAFNFHHWNQLYMHPMHQGPVYWG